MSSTERAPEPTMEEILASIRRIISDDEASTAQQRATSSEYAEQVRADDTEDGAADTQMIDDIARVLSGSAGAASNDDDVDDILDLTEPGNPEDVMMADEPVTILEEVILETEVYVEAPPKLDFAAAFPAQPEIEEAPEPAPIVAETAQTFSEASTNYEEPPEIYEESSQSFEEVPAPISEIPASEPMMAAEPAASLEDPTSALERAIAALKAGDLAAFAREAQSDYAAPEAASTSPEPAYTPPEPAYTPPEPAYTAPEPADEVAPSEPELPSFDTEPELAAVEDEAAIAPEPELEPEPEPIVPAWAAERSSWSQMRETSEPEPEPDLEPEPEPDSELPWRSEDQSWRGAAPANEFELNPTRAVNGGSEHKQHDYADPMSSKSLEDSVKEMLRPLLRQWLDENMPRVLTAALREELENSDMQRR